MSEQPQSAGAGEQIVVKMWTDLVCPWCYIGGHRLRAAIDRRPDPDRFVVRLRSFELNPDAPREQETITESLAHSHGWDPDTVMKAERQVQELAESEGLPFSLDRPNANTFDVHRVLHHAEEQGLGTAYFALLQDRLFAGEGDPFDPEVMVEVAETVGLSGPRVREVIAGDEYADAVRADQEEGVALGVRGVPFTVFDRRYAMSGAQPLEAYTQVLDETAPPTGAESRS